MNLDRMRKAIKELAKAVEELEELKLPMRELNEYRWATIKEWDEKGNLVASVIVVRYVSDNEIYFTRNDQTYCKADLLSLGSKVTM